MITKSVELHNICQTIPGFGGEILERLPSQVRDGMENFRTFKAEYCAGCEIRFVSEAYVTQVTLSCLHNGGMITVYCGDVTYMTKNIREGETITLHLERPVFLPVMEQMSTDTCFAPTVWRIHLPAGKMVLHDVNAYGKRIRPPRQNEKPSKTLLAYGSSITQGEHATNNVLAYIHQTARLLKLDVLNLGFSGACFCEAAMANHIAARGDWDYALLEMGVNMRTRFSPEQFRQRVSYFIDQMCGQNPQKQVFAITIYPNAATWEKNQYWSDEKAFNEILHEICDTRKYNNLVLLNGGAVMTSPSYLMQDLIHPSDYGHMQMAQNLAALLQPYL